MFRCVLPKFGSMRIAEFPTWKDAPESRSHVLDSLVVSRTSVPTGFSIESIFGSFDSA